MSAADASFELQLQTSSPKDNDDASAIDDDSFQWTAITIVQSVFIFLLAGLLEIMGGWLIWAAVRGITDADGQIKKKPWFYAVLGSLTLIGYGFVPCLQPSDDGFGRIYAVYGGYFIVLSFLLAWALEGEAAKPDLGDIVGGIISLIGVLVIMFWPR